MDPERKAEIVDGLLRTAKLHQVRKALDAAVDTCRQALETDPDSGAAQDLMGDLLVARGELEEGLAHYQRALKIEPRAATEDKIARLVLKIHEQKTFMSMPGELSAAPPRQRRVNPTIACGLSMLCPGLGQLYNGDHLKGLVVLGLALLGYVSLAFLSAPNVRALRYALMGSAHGSGPPMPTLFWVFLLGMAGLWAYALIDASITASGIARGGGRPGAKTGWEV